MHQGDKKMVYLLSSIVYIIVLGLGIMIIQKIPKNYERYIIILAVLGFLIQLFINWSSLGNLPVMPQLTNFNRSNDVSFELMILMLISIFCYASLLVIFFKAHDYYYPEDN